MCEIKYPPSKQNTTIMHWLTPNIQNNDTIKPNKIDQSSRF